MDANCCKCEQYLRDAASAGGLQCCYGDTITPKMFAGVSYTVNKERSSMQTQMDKVGKLDRACKDAMLSTGRIDLAATQVHL
jgi:hypothetical protein